VRGAEAERRSQAVHVAVGRVHHGVRLPVGAQDPLALPDARRRRRREVRRRRSREGRARRRRGPTARQVKRTFYLDRNI